MQYFKLFLSLFAEQKARTFGLLANSKEKCNKQ